MIIIKIKISCLFQSESAFKSHNSKLHLERREKSYYCRECDETFSCLVKHSLHIVIHRTWTQEEMGMQCRICGKVFSRTQTLPFHRHLATHDTEPETECSCTDCTGRVEQEKDPLEIRGKTRQRTRQQQPTPTSKTNLLKKMQSLFNKPNGQEEEEEIIDVDSDDEDAVKPFECGLCGTSGKRFSTAEKLEKHVESDHQTPPKSKDNKKSSANASPKIPTTKTITEDIIDEVADEFANEVDKLEAKNSSKNKPKKGQRTMQERNWQECPDRNWAAEFGYGASERSIGVTKDILSKMALSFKSASKDEDDDALTAKIKNEKVANKGYDSGVGIDDEDKIFRTRGFKGNIKASLNRAPRTLSTSSLRTRRRMEALMKRAREFMRKDKIKVAVTKPPEPIGEAEKENLEKEQVVTPPKEVIENIKEKTPEKEISPPETLPEAEKQIEIEKDLPVEEPAKKVTKEKSKCPPPAPAPAPLSIIDEASEIIENVREETVREKAAEGKKVDEEEIVEDDDDEDDLDDDFDGISDGDDDDDTDGLLIPLENGWVCEKRLADSSTNSYSTHFWSPDGQRHSSLTAIKSYGTKKRLTLNMIIFEKALKNSPHK